MQQFTQRTLTPASVSGCPYRPRNRHPDGRTDDQVATLVDHIRSNVDYGRDADEYLATLPDNLADLLDE